MTTSNYWIRVLGTVGLVLLAVLLVLFLYHVGQVLLLLYAGILFAVALDGMARGLSHYTPLSRNWSLFVVAVLLTVFLVGLFWLAGTRVAAQADEFSQRITQVWTQIQDSAWGERLLPNDKSLQSALSSGFLSRFANGLTILVGGLSNTLVVVIIGLFVAISPKLYLRGLGYLFPQDKRHRASEVVEKLGTAQRKWLIGRITSMAIVAVFTVLGLWLVGTPLALSLGVIAGLVSFVPYVGVLVGLVPAVLVGLSVSSTVALYVVLVFVVVQLVESNILLPLIQHRSVSLPPAMLITAQLMLGALAGPLGLLVATPLAVVTISLVQMLYVNDALGYDISVLGE